MMTKRRLLPQQISLYPASSLRCLNLYHNLRPFGLSLQDQTRQMMAESVLLRLGHAIHADVGRNDAFTRRTASFSRPHLHERL